LAQFNASLLAQSGGLDIEPGDRLPLEPAGAPGRFSLPDWFAGGVTPIRRVTNSAGSELTWSLDGAKGELALKGACAEEPQAATWLECDGPGSFRLLAEPAEPLETEECLTDRGVRLLLEGERDRELLFGHGDDAADVAQFELALRAARLATHAGFDRLMCLPLVRDMELLEHQVRTAKTVLHRFRGRAMLCDEVGLGKTIEAGLVLSELHLRGLVRSVLVLVPPSLIEQWQGELRRKFSLDFTSHDDPSFRERGAAAWGEFDRVVASIHTAKREPHRSAITARRWDMVIVDEAHHLRNRTTQVWRFASELQKQFMLLLTATPVQNNLDELFNLVTLLEPGLLSTAKQFQHKFVDRRDKLSPRNVEELHTLLAEVMVRNRRGTVGLQFTRRWAKTECITPGADESSLYHEVAGLVREHLAGGGRAAQTRLALVSLQMALGSSSQAAAGTLEKLAVNAHFAGAIGERFGSLAERARNLTTNRKADRLLELAAEFPDKLVIFTQFRATQDLLAARLAAAGEEVALFHGGLTRMAKEEAIARFRGPTRLLLCTEAGSEGRNLQFAHAVCNFDLPWNPMKIEQRIGRLSRIGQTHDVHVFNLVASGTVEEAVLHLLDAKLCMFEMVIGEIDMILGNLDEEQEFQDLVADLWAESHDTADFARRMEALGDRLLAAKDAYLRQRSHDNKLFGERFAPE